MSESIRIAHLPAAIGTDSSPAHPTARTTTAKPSPASLPRGGSQIEHLKGLGSRGAAGKAAAETARAPLTRDPSFREWMPKAAAAATSHDDDWLELDDIFRRQPAAGQAGTHAPTHSLIDAPQTPLSEGVSSSTLQPLSKSVSTPSPQPSRKSASTLAPAPAPRGLAARQEPARTSSSSGVLGSLKRSAKNLLGLGRASSSPTQKQDAAARPLRAASRPVAAPADSVAETVAWIHEQNGRPTAWRNAIPKLSAEQARREGKAVPTRRPPPPPMSGSAGHAARPAAVTIERNDPTKAKIGAGKVSKPQTQTAETASLRDKPGQAAASRRAGKRPLRAGVDFQRPKLGSLSAIPEHHHETGALASLGQHYDGLWRDLRGSISGANRALQSLRTTPKKGLAAKRAELESHAAELERLMAETGMAEVDGATVQALKNLEAPESAHSPDSLRTRAVLVDRDIHETIRQRNHARIALGTLQRTIASLPQATGR